MIREERRKSRKKKRALIRRIVPAAVALFLIIIVIGVSVAAGMIKKLIYSEEKADLYEYFRLTGEDEAAILMDNEYIEDKATYIDGRYYIPMDLAEDNFCNDFYYDEHEGLLLYTTGSGTKSSADGDGDFIIKNDTAYLSLDYLQKIVNLQVDVYPEPAHIQIKYAWDEAKVANIKRDTQARIRGGIKSEILTELPKGALVEIIDEMEEWSRVKTPDGYLGYVENKLLLDVRTEKEVPVNNVPDKEIVHNLRDHKICLGWHQVMSQAANSTLSNAVAGTKGMNVISPTWFSLADNEGNISNIGDRDYVQSAHGMGLEVWALIDNFNTSVSTYEVLSYTSRRERLINNIVSTAKSLGVDGINIDFENLGGECGSSFAQFIRELSVPCRQNNLVLSVDNYVPKEYTAFYNRKAQGEFADYVIIMGYDEHFAGSTESGSVASFNFVQEGIEKTLLDVDASQVINGIPFYTRVWTEGSGIKSEAYDLATAQEFVKNHGITLAWDDICAQNYGEKTEGGVTYKIWMEDAESIRSKLALMSSNNLAGVACWKLTLETSDIWDEIAAYMAQ